MILYINNTEINNENITSMENVDIAIEKLVGVDVDGIIVSSATEESDMQKLKAITSILSPDTIIVGQTGSLEDSLIEIGRLQYTNRMSQYQFNDTMAPQNISNDINIA